IRQGDNPLDATAVHPEAYQVVDNMAQSLNLQIGQLLGHAQLTSIQPAQFVADNLGEQAVRDVLAELQKPGRDPRPEFRMAKLTEGVEDIKQLVVGSIMEGTVSNVTNFGAFVDLGVHQDGLVHI
ncbi:MAG TPA: RNA-binding transcriptional accessory protein, partial [Oceanospirillaceae bacterium]|nr:RNA-binding transcriptional accessory protein [Oceanospirillaceae bacterium]